MRGDLPPLRMLPVMASSVSPACAGIYLKALTGMMYFLSLPRVRGDLPTPRTHFSVRAASPPRARGSTYLLR